MWEFGGLWKHEHNQHALVLPKTECGCPSGGGLKNAHIRYPSYLDLDWLRWQFPLLVLSPTEELSGRAHTKQKQKQTQKKKKNVQLALFLRHHIFIVCNIICAHKHANGWTGLPQNSHSWSSMAVRSPQISNSESDTTCIFRIYPCRLKLNCQRSCLVIFVSYTWQKCSVWYEGEPTLFPCSTCKK